MTTECRLNDWGERLTFNFKSFYFTNKPQGFLSVDKFVLRKTWVSVWQNGVVYWRTCPLESQDLFPRLEICRSLKSRRLPFCVTVVIGNLDVSVKSSKFGSATGISCVSTFFVMVLSTTSREKLLQGIRVRMTSSSVFPLVVLSWSVRECYCSWFLLVDFPLY